jgi:hypothetical protein
MNDSGFCPFLKVLQKEGSPALDLSQKALLDPPAHSPKLLSELLQSTVARLHQKPERRFSSFSFSPLPILPTHPFSLRVLPIPPLFLFTLSCAVPRSLQGWI